MGRDLTLVPVEATDPNLGHTQLCCFRRRELFEQIDLLPKEPVLKNFYCFLAFIGEEQQGYGIVTHDPYGEPLRMVRVESLLALRTHPDVVGQPANRAIWAYLAELPADRQVVLYWE
jgi:hypothetical protein